MREKTRTLPNLTDTSPLHQEALAKGNDHFRDWEKNVADHFKGKPDEEIKAELQSTAHPFAVCFEHLINDFNMGTAIRNANAFNAKEVFYVGDKRWDRRAAVGVYNYTPVNWIPTLEEFTKLQEKYVVVGIDNVAGSVPLSTYRFNNPKNIASHRGQHNTLLVFGEEGVGLTAGMQAFCRDIVHIEQYGSVRSLNLGVASGIIMHEFVKQMRETNG